MIKVTFVDELRAQVSDWRAQGQRIGFVPTMGNLHAGHMALIKAARQNADRVVVSIFVNPMQFGPHEDYASYPRTLESDQRQLQASDADLLFLPSVETMYGVATADLSSVKTKVLVSGLSNILCGASRPGHFEGVAAVVVRLFNQVMPDVAVFGEKDFQQLLIIRSMAADLAFRTEIIGVPTVREHDGLAMSSRNQYLSDAQRQIAPQLFARLKAVVEQVLGGRRDYEALCAAAAEKLDQAGFCCEYVVILRENDLKIPEKDDKKLIVLAAARLGTARLIDHLVFELK